MIYNLLFRRQFILSNTELVNKYNWKNLTIESNKNKWNLLFQQDLEVSYLNASNKIILLIGYIIDPYKPDYTNNDILQMLLQCQDFDAIIKKSLSFNGRFLLFYFTDDFCGTFNDATGFRELYYCFKSNNKWFGSTPNLIAEFTGIEITNDVEIIDFWKSQEFSKNDNLWIGFRTLFDNVYQLPPNFWLDIIKNKLVRFWPDTPILKEHANTVAEKIAFILKNSLKSAIKKYKIHMGLTAGWDTRLLLAASKDWKDEIFYFVNKPMELNWSLHDIKIPTLLSKKFNFKLNILEIPDYVDEDFKYTFFKNNILAHPKLLKVFYHNYLNKFDDTYVTTGAMANGLARIYYRLPKKAEISSESIVSCIGYNQIKYASNEIEFWLSEAYDVAKKYQIDIMDLYQIEQDNNHWGSLTASEQNIVREEFRPFNSRELISLFLSLEDKYRYQHYPEIYVRTIKILWKDLLNVKINPRHSDFLIRIFRTFGIEQRIYSLYKSLFH